MKDMIYDIGGVKISSLKLKKNVELITTKEEGYYPIALILYEYEVPNENKSFEYFFIDAETTYKTDRYKGKTRIYKLIKDYYFERRVTI